MLNKFIYAPRKINRKCPLIVRDKVIGLISEEVCGAIDE